MEKRFTGRINILALIGICLTVYFSYHLIFGERSLLSLASLKNTQETLEADYAKVTAEKDILIEKVQRMRPGSLDGDLVQEQMSKMLGFYAPESQVVLSPGSRS